jgi:FkbM family methyltransferase
MDLSALIYEVRKSPNIMLRISEELKFIGHCLANANDSQSQNYQDVFVLYETNYKRDGYFVEFGATDGISISNTLLLQEKYGWQGILAEPNPYWHEALEKNRSHQHISKECVYSETGKEIEFIASNAPDLSSIKELAAKDEHEEARNEGQTILVKTTSLVDLLDKYEAPEEIDYLSIDTEGGEYIILKAFFDNPKKYTIKTMTVEHNYIVQDREKIHALLVQNGYKRKFQELSRCDDFYVKG